jgi:hypothetical protein
MSQQLYIRAILEKDLHTLLERLGLASKVDEGTYICRICGRIITWDNLGGFIVHNKQPVLFCDSADCVEASRIEENG